MSSHLPVGQEGLHPRLAQIVERHLREADRTPVPEHTEAAYAMLKAHLQIEPRALVLDSGCGTGHSTAQLALEHPDAWVIGADQSAVRLRKGPAGGRLRGGVYVKDNLLLLRADVPSLWRRLVQDGHRLHTHYVLYPNPWPKKRHVMRRWHAHPAFSALLALGGRLELRVNWPLYAEEMAHSLRTAARAQGLELELEVGAWHPEVAHSRFEAKYVGSGHALTRLVARWG